MEKAYRLQLANGDGWNLLATEGAEFWVDRLASVMELRPCELNGYPKLIVAKEEIAGEDWGEPVCALDMSIRERLPSSGWKSKDRTMSHLDLHIRSWYHSEVPDVIYWIGHDESHMKNVIRMWSLVNFIHLRELLSGGFPLHSALVKRDGCGVLLAARGGTGKSTCCRRIPPPWHALADDQTLIIRDDQGQYLAHPFPTWSEHIWRRSERTWDVQKHVPLSAIFFLRQAEDDEATPIGQSKAAVFTNELAMEGCVLGMSNLSREELTIFRRGMFDNVCEFVKATPAYMLGVSLHGKFWEEMEKVL